MGLAEIDIGLRDDLRTNITDPLGRTSEWIHFDSLNTLATIGKTPAIFIERAPGGAYYRSIGTSVTEKFPKYQIHIAVRTTDRGRIGGVDITSSSRLMSELMDDVSERLEVAAVSVASGATVYFQESDSGGIWDFDDNTKVNTMEFQVVQKV